MIKRFIGFVVLAALLVSFGYLFYQNPSIVDFHLTPGRVYSLPLPLLLLFAFLSGAALIFVLAIARETQWTVADLRRRRRERRLTRHRAALDAGRRLYWAGRSDRARGVLRRELRSPDGLEAALSLAEASLDSNRPQEAKDLLEASRNDHPNEPHLLSLLAVAHRRLGQQQQATTCLEQAVAAAPESPRLLAALRDSYVSEERWGDALRTEESLLEALPRPDQILAEQTRLLGLRYESALAADGAVAATRELRAALSRDAGFLPAAIALGDRLRQAGERRDAGRIWARTARLRPEPVLLSRIESLYKELERPKKVLALYRRLRRRHDSLTLLLRHVRFLLSEGRSNEAAAELESAGSPFNAVPAFQALQGEVCRLRGSTGQALEAFRRALDAQISLETPYACRECDRVFAEWRSRCPGCGTWDSLRSKNP